MRLLITIILILVTLQVKSQCVGCLPMGSTNVPVWVKGPLRVDGALKLSQLAAGLGVGDTMLLYVTKDSIVRVINKNTLGGNVDSSVFATVTRLKDSISRLNDYIDSLYSSIGTHDSLVKYSDSVNLWVSVARLADSAADIRADLLSALNSHLTDFNNPHQVTKEQVGLSNVDNTSDVNKPVSTATQTALNTKEPTISAGTTAQYWRGDKTWQAVSGLPISTATQTALDAKVGGSGTVNYLSKFITSTTLGNSIIKDTGNRVGINLAVPLYTFDVNGTARINNWYYTSEVSDFRSGSLYNFDTTSDFGWARDPADALNAFARFRYGFLANQPQLKLTLFKGGSAERTFTFNTSGLYLDASAMLESNNISSRIITMGSGTTNTFMNFRSTSAQYIDFLRSGIADLGSLGFNAGSVYFEYRSGSSMGGSQRFVVFNDGNFGINVNDVNAGYKLDVNGTIRTQSTLTTAQPTASGAGAMKFGKILTGSDTNKYLEIEVDGTDYYIRALTALP